MTDLASTDARPFSYFETYELVVTSAASDRQLMRAPWPIDMYVELISVSVANQSSSAAQVVMWDQDLSNSTPTTRGSAGQAIQAFTVTGSALSGVYAARSDFSPPQSRFYGGIALRATELNTQIAATVRIAR